MEDKLKSLIDERFDDFKKTLLVTIQSEFEKFVLEKKAEISNYIDLKMSETSKEPLKEHIQSINKIKEHVQELQAKQGKLMAQNIVLSRTVDDMQQYVRRQNVRIFGVKVEEGEDCMALVHDLVQKNNVDIPKSSIDRAHRIGKKVTDKNGVLTQPIIVRFTSFRDRTIFYKKRKDIRRNSGVGVVVDLTHERLTLLLAARDLISSVESIEFAYADINCNIRVFTSSKKHLSFSSIADLQIICNA